MVPVKTTMAAEHQFLDMLNRISGMRENAVVLYIRISILTSANRSQNQVRMTTGILNELMAKSQICLFVLSNKDIVVIGRNMPTSVIEGAINSVHRIFQSDPIASMHGSKFVTLYHLNRDFQTVMQIAKEREEEFQRQTTQTESAPKDITLAPEHLDAILRNIQNFNILKIIRRQEAIQITRSGNYVSLFLEYFTSMADLKKAIAPDVDVLSNRWLFQHLSETLDKRMLGISKELFQHTPKDISLNLNISTIFSPAFDAFLEELPQDKKVVIEVQLMDITQNTKNYLIAKDLLHDAGHKILIDGLHPISFEFLDISLFDPDLMKLNWSAALTEEETAEKFAETIKNIDPEKIVLMRCENEDAIKWGLSNGVSRFQGYFIDALSGTGVRRKCITNENCSNVQCVSRKACIAGPIRAQCQSPEMLDHPIEDNL